MGHISSNRGMKFQMYYNFYATNETHIQYLFSRLSTASNNNKLSFYSMNRRHSLDIDALACTFDTSSTMRNTTDDDDDDEV